MGKMLNMLFGRTSKGSKLKALVNLAISRLALLKNNRQARCSYAISDVVYVLQESEHERALIRVEHVVRERNMLDAYAIIHGYCILISEKIQLIEQEKNCPEDLKEAISSLIFAASRIASGDFPELQRIRSVFASRYDREFIVRAIELRNNCGVNPQLIRKLSTRQPSLESRTMVLKEIADKNGISLQLEEAPSTPAMKGEDKRVNENPKTLAIPEFGEELKGFSEEIMNVESLCISMNRRKQYKDAQEAARDAFLLATYAATAAKAAVKLSLSSYGGSTDDFNHSDDDRKYKVSNISEKVKSSPELIESKHSWTIEDYSDSDYAATSTSDESFHIRPGHRSLSSSMSSGLLGESEDNEELDDSDDAAKTKMTNYNTIEEWGMKGTNLPYYSHNKIASGYEASYRKDNDEQLSTNSDVKGCQRFNTAIRPFSVRTRG